MSISRDDIPALVSDLLDARDVRWLERTAGDFDGIQRTIEVFDADAKEQGALLKHLRGIRPQLEAACGGPLVVVFHTRRETERLYRRARQRNYRALAVRFSAWLAVDHSTETPFDLEEVKRTTLEAA